MKTRLLRINSIRELNNAILDNLDKYRVGNFSFLKDDSSRYFEIDQQLNEEKIINIRCENGDDREAINCETLFAALPDMTPYLARDERFWIYLTHVDLLEYSRKRWPIPEEKEKAINHIRTHFFINGVRGIERDNSASRLWWMAYISSQCQSLSLMEALQCLLFRSDVRANIIERPTTAQNPTILSAILSKLYESYQKDQHLFNRETFRDIMIELNLLGGVRLLDSLEKDCIDNIINSLTNP
jgi:hypothetical protein